MINNQKILLVGEAPGRLGLTRPPLYGRTRQLIMNAAGISENEFDRLFATTNLFTSWQGGDEHGDYFSLYKARPHASNILDNSTHQTIVLVGLRTATAFGLKVTTNQCFKWFKMKHRQVAVMPHTSGRNRWWNSHVNREVAAKFMHELVQLAINQKSQSKGKAK